MRLTPVPKTPASETIPQYSQNRLKDCIRAVGEADVTGPIDDWLTGQSHLSEFSRRQVRSALGFIGVLTEPWRQNPHARMISAVEAWRADRYSLFTALLQRFRAGYAAAGCDKESAGLIGNPDLPEDALGRVLKSEPPFQKLNKKPDTRRNAIRFACHVHRLFLENRAFLRKNEEFHTHANPRFGAGFDTEPEEPETRPGPRLRDHGTVVNARQYRVGRVEGDLWVYGNVQFETPQGLTDPDWINRLGSEEQARFMEQLAAALLQDADSLRQHQSKT